MFLSVGIYIYRVYFVGSANMAAPGLPTLGGDTFLPGKLLCSLRPLGSEFHSHRQLGGFF